MIGLLGVSFLFCKTFHLVSVFGRSIFLSEDAHPVLNTYALFIFNGLRSIIQHCSPDFSRIRIGIGHPNKKEVIDYVLSRPNKVDQKTLNSAVLNAAEAIETILDQGIDEAMNQFN